MESLTDLLKVRTLGNVTELIPQLLSHVCYISASPIPHGGHAETIFGSLWREAHYEEVNGDRSLLSASFELGPPQWLPMKKAPPSCNLKY